jgi:hypothetical protein
MDAQRPVRLLDLPRVVEDDGLKLDRALVPFGAPGDEPRELVGGELLARVLDAGQRELCLERPHRIAREQSVPDASLGGHVHGECKPEHFEEVRQIGDRGLRIDDHRQRELEVFVVMMK